MNEENKQVAEDFLKYVGTVYKELSDYFNEKYGWDEGLLDDAILKVYKYVLNKGVESRKNWKGLLFMAANNLQKDRYRKKKVIDTDRYMDMQQHSTTEEKVDKDIMKSWSVMELLDIVENNFDQISFYCWRVYHLVPGTTYKKLRNITNVRDAKERVVEVNKFLRENLTWNDMVKAYNSDKTFL